MAGTDSTRDTAPDAAALANEVQTLKTEVAGAIGRAQKRYTEKLHAQAEVRRAQIEIRGLRSSLQDRDAIAARVFTSYQATVEKLNGQLANADGLRQMQQHAAEAQQLKQHHAAQIKQMQDEHNQKISEVGDRTRKLLDERGEKVKAAQQAEQMAKDEAAALGAEVKSLRAENLQKGQEIGYLKRELQNRSAQLAEAQRAPEPQKWTPRMQASPRAPQTPTRLQGNFSSSVHSLDPE
jgi:chromosome segregation ATPase